MNNNAEPDNTMLYGGIALVMLLCSSSSSFLLTRGKSKKPAAAKKRRRRRCFSPETLIKLQNGDEVAMKDLKLGDVLINGSVVKATMKIKNDNDPYYKLPGSIHVTGSHYIKDGDKYVQVKDFLGAELTTQTDPVVSCLVTDDHKIPVGDFIFWDWEDNLLQIPSI